jgi:hypothetical protein
MPLDTANNKHSDLFFHAITLTILLYFSAMVIYEIHQAPFMYDTAGQIEVSDILAHDIGTDITAYQNELFLVQTTGPTLTLPGAALVLLLGPHIWTAGLAAALCSLFALGGLLICLHKIFPPKNLAAITLALACVFTWQDLRWWVWMIGDNAALLLCLTAASITCNSNLSFLKRHIFFTLVASLALQAKLTSLPLLAGCALFLFITHLLAIHNGKTSSRQLITYLAIDMALLTITLLPYNVIEYSFYHNQQTIPYGEFIRTRLDTLSNNSAVGIGKLLQSPQLLTDLLRNIGNSHQLLGKHLTLEYGLPPPAAWTLPCAALFVSCVSLLKIVKPHSSGPKNTLDNLLACLFFPQLLSIVWFFILASLIFDRYTFHLTNLSMIILALGLLRYAGPAILIISLVLIMVSVPHDRHSPLASRLTFSITPDSLRTQEYNQLIVDTAAYLQQHEFRYPLAKCGTLASSRALNYLLPGTNNFVDSTRLIRSALEEDTSGKFHWKETINFTLVIDNTSWRFVKNNPKIRAMQNALLAACKDGLLLENPAYRVMECRFENLQQHIPLDRDTGFATGKPYN